MSRFHFVRYGRTRHWAVMAGAELLCVVVYRKGAAALVALLRENERMTTHDTGDAWCYCDPGKLAEPAAVQALVQAALNAFLTVRYARTKVNPEEVGTHVDWPRIERELQAALRAAGHPAGDMPG